MEHLTQPAVASSSPSLSPSLSPSPSSPTSPSSPGRGFLPHSMVPRRLPTSTLPHTASRKPSTDFTENAVKRPDQMEKLIQAFELRDCESLIEAIRVGTGRTFTYNPNPNRRLFLKDHQEREAIVRHAITGTVHIDNESNIIDDDDDEVEGQFQRISSTKTPAQSNHTKKPLYIQMSVSSDADESEEETKREAASEVGAGKAAQKKKKRKNKKKKRSVSATALAMDADEEEVVLVAVGGEGGKADARLAMSSPARLQSTSSSLPVCILPTSRSTLVDEATITELGSDNEDNDTGEIVVTMPEFETDGSTSSGGVSPTSEVIIEATRKPEFPSPSSIIDSPAVPSSLPSRPISPSVIEKPPVAETPEPVDPTEDSKAPSPQPTLADDDKISGTATLTVPPTPRLAHTELSAESDPFVPFASVPIIVVQDSPTRPSTGSLPLFNPPLARNLLPSVTPDELPAPPSAPIVRSPPVPGYHPLDHAWTLYFSGTTSSLSSPSAASPLANSAQTYEDGLVKLFTSSSLEDLLGSWKALRRRIASSRNRPIEALGLPITPGSAGLGLHYMKDDNNFHFFVNNVRPMWEDPMFVKGGKIMLTGAPNLLDNVFLEIVLRLIGGDLLEACPLPPWSRSTFGGVVLSRRKINYRIELWMGGPDRPDFAWTNAVFHYMENTFGAAFKYYAFKSFKP